MDESRAPTITVGHLRSEIAQYPDSFTLDFSGLEFLRVKQRGETHLQIEFSQAVYLDDRGRVVVHDPK